MIQYVSPVIDLRSAALFAQSASKLASIGPVINESWTLYPLSFLFGRKDDNILSLPDIALYFLRYSSDVLLVEPWPQLRGVLCSLVWSGTISQVAEVSYQFHVILYSIRLLYVFFCGRMICIIIRVKFHFSIDVYHFCICKSFVYQQLLTQRCNSVVFIVKEPSEESFGVSKSFDEMFFHDKTIKLVHGCGRGRIFPRSYQPQSLLQLSNS